MYFPQATELRLLVINDAIKAADAFYMMMDLEQPCFSPKGKQDLLNPQRIFPHNAKRIKS